MKKLIKIFIVLSMCLVGCNTVNKDVADPIFNNEPGLHTGKLDILDFGFYVPENINEETGLLLLLHGCGWAGPSFFDEIHMKEYADEYNYVAVFPSQNRTCNSDGCWNYFNQTIQNGNALEIRNINSIVSKVIEACNINKDKVYVTGLSAGGAMSMVLFMNNDMYKGVANVSGVAYGLTKNYLLANDVLLDPDLYDKDYYNEEFIFNVSKDKQKALIIHGDSDARVAYKNSEVSLQQIQKVFDYIDDGNINDSLLKTESETELYKNISYNDGQVEFYLLKGGIHTWYTLNNNDKHKGIEEGNNATAMVSEFFFGSGKLKKYS